MLRSLFWVEIATLETTTVYKCLGLHFPHVHYFAFTNTQFHLSLCCLVSQEFEMLLQFLMGILVSITMNNSVSSANFITPLLSIFFQIIYKCVQEHSSQWKTLQDSPGNAFRYQNQAILCLLAFNQLIIHKSNPSHNNFIFWILCWETLLRTLPLPLHQLDHSTTCS